MAVQLNYHFSPCKIGRSYLAHFVCILHIIDRDLTDLKSKAICSFQVSALCVSLFMVTRHLYYVQSPACPGVIDPALTKIESGEQAFRFVITQYQRTSTPDCHLPVCDLNLEREPVETVSLPERDRCQQVRDCVTVCITTRHRLSLVAGLVKSVQIFYPGTRIVVVDEFYMETDDKTFPREWLDIYDTMPIGLLTYKQNSPGVGLGRKMATLMATTKYVLVVDDDFVFTEDTNIMTLVKALDTTDLTIASGAVDEPYRFDGVMRVVSYNYDIHLVFYPGVFFEYLGSDNECFACDITKNFFLANRETILAKGSWDTTRLFFEHEDFFLSMRKGRAKVAHCPNVHIRHNDKDTSLRKRRKLHYKAWSNHLKVKWQFEEYYYCKYPAAYLECDYCLEHHREVPGWT